MSVHITDSIIFKNSWSTPELRTLFDDTALTKGWIEVMVVLAETEASFGLIPALAAQQLADVYRNIQLDAEFLNEVREGFEQSNHSLLGLIRALQRRSPGESGEWWCYGATVQDITDTHTARLLLAVCDKLCSQLNSLVESLSELARRYRDTPMCGRTHGQPGLPITFGFKVAGWLDEMHRHRQRLVETKKRIAVGQLGGGVGSLSAFGPEALNLQQHFLKKLGLVSPVISWTASRDRLAEWLNLLSLITSTADRIGHEIYNLQRPEIGELSEGFVPGTVGSITMPQKRNPEISEHLGTLARLVRHQAAHMNENLVHDHERDGRSWKSEWAILPGSCLAANKTLLLLQTLLEHLQVNTDQMQNNLLATKGFIYAEQVMLALTPKLGKQSAHTLVYRVAMAASERDITLREAMLAEPEVISVLGANGIEEQFDMRQSTGRCGQMVDQVLDDIKAWVLAGD
jgi:adenylosuccinate lyase